jgi:predicted Fe-Mo cluster-binding NifX family protein
LVDMDDREVKHVDAVANPYYHQHVPGAVPDFIRSHGVDVMLTGGMGRRAIGFFQQYGIEAVTGAYGTVRQGLEQYLGGGLQGAQPCRESTEHECDQARAQDEYEQDQVGRLREEAEALQQQLAEVQERLNRLNVN